MHLLDSPKATTADLMTHIQGPDYPTEAQVITPAEDIQALYETGRGSIEGARAVYHREGPDVVITAYPIQVSPARYWNRLLSR